MSVPYSSQIPVQTAVCVLHSVLLEIPVGRNPLSPTPQGTDAFLVNFRRKGLVGGVRLVLSTTYCLLRIFLVLHAGACVGGVEHHHWHLRQGGHGYGTFRPRPSDATGARGEQVLPEEIENALRAHRCGRRGHDVAGGVGKQETVPKVTLPLSLYPHLVDCTKTCHCYTPACVSLVTGLLCKLDHLAQVVPRNRVACDMVAERR